MAKLLFYLGNPFFDLEELHAKIHLDFFKLFNLSMETGVFGLLLDKILAHMVFYLVIVSFKVFVDVCSLLSDRYFDAFLLCLKSLNLFL